MSSSEPERPDLDLQKRIKGRTQLRRSHSSAGADVLTLHEKADLVRKEQQERHGLGQRLQELLTRISLGGGGTG